MYEPIDWFFGFLISLVVGFILVAVIWVVDEQVRLNDAIDKASQICGDNGNAKTYDVSNQETLVFSCEDGRLRTLDY